MNLQTKVCPICGEGALSAVTFSDTFKHNGQDLIVAGLEGHQCAGCEATPLFPEQIRRNQLRITDAKRAADGLLSGAQIRKVRELLGLSQQDAAVIFGGGPNGFSKYERGETAQSVPMDRLLRLLTLDPSKLDQLKLMAGLPVRYDRD